MVKLSFCLKNKKNIIKGLVCLGILLNPLTVKADWAGCYSQLNGNTSYSDGEIITYELGSKGVTSNQSISGFHYHIEYDPTVLEPVSGGSGNYWNWGTVNSQIKTSSWSRFNTLIVDVQTQDKSKMITSERVNSSSDNFVKLGYVKFKVINTSQTSTKLTLVQSWEDDRANYSSKGSSTSYKYIWLFDPQTDELYRYDYETEYDYQEPCYDTVTTYINLYKKAYINNIIINNSVIKNYNKDVYEYNLTYTTKTINISANTTDGYIISGDIGNKTLNYGNNIFKIAVTSPTGDKKEYTLNVNYPDNRSNVNTLKTLTLSTGTIDFKPEQTTYDLEVDYEVDKITINSELTNSKSSYIKDFGNREVNLEIGKNEILIKVQSEKGTENVYTINVTRKEATNTCDIKDIIISGYKFAFDTSKTNYTLTVAPEVTNLDINITLINEKSSYKIIGNKNLENGSQIKIKVTDENNKEKDYIINIIKDMTIIEKQKNKNIIIIFSSIIGIGIVTTAGIIIYLKKKKKTTQSENNSTY